MTERGLPIVDGAPACPFVAFEDDRDERASSPDHRHRCYAELQPAPRALAHQEAYCLASAFPVCPTFQDWARREAARARAGSGGVVPPTPARDQAERNPPRDWLAPPPWSGGSGGSAGADEVAAGVEDADAPDFLSGRSRPDQGLAGSAADRLARSAGAAEPPAATPSDRMAGEPSRAERADRARIDREPDDEPDEIELVPPRPAARPAEPIPPPARSSEPDPEPEPETRRRAASAPPPSDDDDEDWDDEDDEWEEAPPPARPRRDRPDRSRGTLGMPLGQDRRPRVGDTRPRRERTGGPSWEQPRRFEAYPTLKTRVGLSLPSFGAPPRLTVIFLALVVAAIALFFLPALLGIGQDRDTGGGPGASPTVSVAPSVEPATPTPVPQPTQQIYLVQPGDTMSRIANRFGVSLGDLIEANRETIPDPDTLDVGDEVIIPAPPPDEIPGGSPDPSLVVP